MIRLFAAIAVPDDLAEPLARRREEIEGVHWRPIDAYHITLRFFGGLREDVADDLDLALSTLTTRPFALSLQGVGIFAEGADLQHLWAGVSDSEPLRALARRCETAARKTGLKPETRVYKPHVTLAYLRRADGPRVAQWIQANNLLHSPAFAVDRFGLYSSWPTHDGSRYRLEREYLF